MLSFLRLPPSTAFQTVLLTMMAMVVDYDGYSISSNVFVPTVVDIMVYSIPVYVSLLTPKMSCHYLFGYFQFALIHGPNNPGSYQYCSLQHQTLLPSPVTSTTGCCFCFGSVSSLFLEFFLQWFPVAHWAPTDLGNSSFTVLSFCLFILFMGFSRQEYWSGLPFPSPVDHVLSELSTVTCASLVALRAWLRVSLS